MMSLYFDDIFRERDNDDNHIWSLKLNRMVEDYVSLDTLLYRDKPKKRFNLSRLIDKYRGVWKMIIGVSMLPLAIIGVALLGYFLTEVIEHWLLSLTIFLIISVSSFVIVKYINPYIKRKRDDRRRLDLMYQVFNLPVHDKDGATFQFLGAYLDVGYSTANELIFVLPPDSIRFSRFGTNMMFDLYFHSVDEHPDRFTRDDVVSLFDMVMTVNRQHYMTKLTGNTMHAIKEMRRIRDKNERFKRESR